MQTPKQKTWESFTPVGGRLENQPQPTFRSRVYSALGTLLISFIFSTVAGVIISLFIVGLSNHIRFITVPGWVYPGVFLGAWGWTLWNWFQGLREEAGTRHRIEDHIRSSTSPTKAQPQAPDNDQDSL